MREPKPGETWISNSGKMSPMRIEVYCEHFVKCTDPSLGIILWDPDSFNKLYRLNESEEIKSILKAYE